ncbi:MAG TPA: bifunctional acetate--CoA ligase family protein/GNAT family N-acetyltransferase [Xanthobacteraceae bacterium]|nr:bifunctional acetate--CoA ligase family protein/GNAT family N-acetyltransferase [Xanthobacteraceae bacterium]
MSTYRLEKLLSPSSVAIIGASPKETSVGRKVLRNLRDGGFPGEIHLVNPRYGEIDGRRTVPSLRDLPQAPDVIVVTTPPETVPAIVSAAGEKGVATAIIITAGLGRGPGSLAETCEQAARATGLRLVGPNCLGVVAPRAQFNATFAARMPLPGDLALISQSGAIAAGMIEWSVSRAVGFSGIVSIGDQLDVDLGDLLDFFAVDRSTRAILLYIESVKEARKFLSAARSASRTKPVVVVKAGRHAQAAQAAATHTGALAGSDAVYEAAFRRAGLLRVFDLGELFDAAETLGRVKVVGGKRLAILTNGGGIGVLAVDRLADLGGAVAEISPDTRARLDAVLPPTWSKSNPIDIIGDADDARYVAALEALLADPANDAVLVMNVQTALAPAVDIARAVARVAERARTQTAPKPVFAVWVGADGTVAEAFSRAGVPHYATETEAVRGFMHLVRYREATEALLKTPPSLPEHFVPDVAKARRIVEAVLVDGRVWLDPLEAVELFAAYAIPIVPTLLARTPDEAEAKAAEFLTAGHAVAVKIVSRDIVHKSDVGGVRLNLTSGPAVRKAAEEVIAAAKLKRPQARIAGVTVQPMILRPKARELIAGIADDATFGPVIMFGHGGTAVEVIDDKALALPPLDLKLARDLIDGTRVSRLLRAYRNVPEVKIDDIALVLVKLAQLVADLPEIRELDINPLLADETGVLALDARVAVAVAAPKFKGGGHPHLAIRPYPREWERHIVLADNWRVFVRPVRPEDEALVRAFFEKVTPDDLRLRFFAPVKELSTAFVVRLTQLDYARANAFVAIDEATGEMIGGVRLHADANYETGEFAILLRSDLKGRGLGWKLMQHIIDYARAEGLRRIQGQILRENTVMIRMCKELGFVVADDPDDPNLCVATFRLS